MRGECHRLNWLWSRHLVIGMRIKWQSCNWLLCYHQHLQKQEDSYTIIFQTTLVSVNFNACIQKKRKWARYASFTLCFSASLNMDWQILLAPTRFFLKKKLQHHHINVWSLFLWCHTSEVFPFWETYASTGTNYSCQCFKHGLLFLRSL